MTPIPSGPSKAGMGKIELETMTGVTLSVERYNQLVEHEAQRFVETGRKIRAYRLLRSFCAGEARDFDKLEALIDKDEAYKLSPGIAIVISEADKDWVVPMAHEHGYTLGSWMQLIFDRWLESCKRARP